LTGGLCEEVDIQWTIVVSFHRFWTV